MIAAIFIGALYVAGGSGCVAAEVTPVEVYGHLPTLEDLALSPDGTKVAFIKTEGDERNVYVTALNEAKVLGTAHIGDTKLRAIEWVDNENILFEISSTIAPDAGPSAHNVEWFQLITLNVATKKVSPMTFQVPGEITYNVLKGAYTIREVNGATTLFVPGLFYSHGVLNGLFKYDVAHGNTHLIAKGSRHATEWLIDDAGAIVGDFTYRDGEKDWELSFVGDKGKRNSVSGTALIDVPTILGFNDAGDSVLFEFVENDETIWKPLRLKDGTWGAPLANGQTLRAPLVDRNTGRIIGGIQGIDESHYVFFDNELQAHWDALLRAFPDEQVSLISHSGDYSKLLVRVLGARDGYVYALFDWYSHQFAVLGRVYKGLDAVAEVRQITYRAADGLEIPAYLTLPHGRPEANLPLVVLPHGGPAEVDSKHFDWWAQALAAQGYAVIQPNFRGSTLSQRFMEAGYGEWGRKMQTDLSDAVHYLAQQGTIDPKRVCIVGASYGGYAALAGVTLDPGVYRCAVSVAGVSDLSRLLRWTNARSASADNLSQRYWDRFMGVKGPDDHALQAISPVDHVDAVTAPVLLIHGLDDSVVPYEQSQIMADALKRAGKSVDFVTLEHEDHWLSRNATRFQMLQTTVRFLKANNPPD
jgi:cephalosporin-C deacetylase-like acetyl esterase